MNIGIVCYPTFGGSGVIATELGKGLANHGHSVHFITYRQPARLESFHENIYYHEVRLNDYPLFEHPPYDTALTSKIVDVCLHEHLDILHVHYAIPHASTAYFAKQILKSHDIQLPVVTTLHGTDITLVGKDPVYEPVVTFSINNSDGVTAVSESLKRDTYEHFDIVKDIEVIPNFVDFNRFVKTNKEHFKKAIAPNGERILVHISNFRKVKRVQDVIKMFCIISKEIPSKLLMIGDGPERVMAENMVRNICHSDVRFLGKQEAVEEVLSIADLFILPSESESFGLAALEAMACEVPVLSSNAGGIPEVNIDGVTGFTVNVGDIDAYVKKAFILLNDNHLLQRFKKQAFEEAEKYDLNKILPLYEKFYQKIIEESKTKVTD
ncbi:MAG: N-acetyl-alpha-D-glucosaminyl L-malate synthase BshA [Chitinophagales bacterium]|nr:N-acetyl-alpha-D-glucosaminyl L-malate synthase BshA [Chitinophagales bacterium]